MKYFLKTQHLFIVGLFVSLNVFATKIAPISLEELLSNASMVAVVDIQQASLSTDKYRVVHSGEEKNYLNYIAIVVDSTKSSETGNAIKFSSREPLFVNQTYLIFLIPSKSGELFVAQVGFAAFEKAYISFEEGVKEGIRVPSSYISLSKGLGLIQGVTKLNEQSSYVWVEWLTFQKWLTSYLGSLHPVK